MLEDVGPGTERLAELGPGDGLWVLGPLGRGFEPPRRGPARAALRRRRRHRAARDPPGRAARDGADAPALLGFRDAEHARGAELLHEPLVATDDGSAGHAGLVTELLERELDDDGDAVVYACGPPPMLEAVRELCETRGVAAQLALESGWRAASAPASAASFRCARAATCASASTARSSTPRALDTCLVAGAGH